MSNEFRLGCPHSTPLPCELCAGHPVMPPLEEEPTLRDRFAMAALTGLLASERPEEGYRDQAVLVIGVPMTPKNRERAVCTPESPAKHDDRMYVHPAAISDGECSEGCCDYYKCPVCGIRWRSEVAQ